MFFNAWLVSSDTVSQQDMLDKGQKYDERHRDPKVVDVTMKAHLIAHNKRVDAGQRGITNGEWSDAESTLLRKNPDAIFDTKKFIQEMERVITQKHALDQATREEVTNRLLREMKSLHEQLHRDTDPGETRHSTTGQGTQP